MNSALSVTHGHGNDVGMWAYWVSGLRLDNVGCPFSCEGRSVGIR